MIDKNARVLLIYTGGTIGMVENVETRKNLNHDLYLFIITLIIVIILRIV